MPFRLTKRMLSIVLLTLVLVITGCSGGGDDDADGGEPVSAATSAEIGEAMTSVLDTVGEAMDEIQIASKNNPDIASRQAEATVDVNLSCEESGQVSLNASSDFNQDTGEINFDATLSFDGCDGINGSLTFDGEGTLTEEEITFKLTLDGSVDTPTCDLAMDEFTQTMTFVDATEEFALTIDGKITGSCAEESFACTFDDDTIDVSSDSSETQHIEENCYQT